MTYMIKGYVFNKDQEACEIFEGIKVKDFDEAHELFKTTGILNYLFILKEEE